MRSSRVAEEGQREGGEAGSRAARVLSLPETQVAFFGFLLNYPWEMLQVPFFVGMPEMRHWDAVLECTWTTVSDAALLVLAFWVGAAVERSRAWLKRPRASAVAAFLATGLLATVGLEWLATEVWGRWQYAPLMPTLPGLGTGLVPLLQWTVLPPLLLWLVRRQLLGAAAIAAAPDSADAGSGS